VSGGTPTYRFGPFELRTASRTLLRDGQPVGLPPRHTDVLIHLLSNAGRIVSKDDLITAAWKDQFVGPNSLDKVVSDLRRELGGWPGDGRLIETVRRRGVRFAAAVSREDRSTYEASLAPHLLSVEGRRALETFSTAGAAEGRAKFEAAVSAAPTHAPAHVGLAMACAMEFEATRADAEPDIATLALAVKHAFAACQLDPNLAAASSALAFVLSRAGHRIHALAPYLGAAGVPAVEVKAMNATAVAAARQATTIESGNWRNDATLAAAAWGEEALGAFRRVVSRVSSFPLAYVMAARILIARQQLAEAERELRAGAEADDLQRTARGPFGAAGVHLLWGLLRLAADDHAAADGAFERELGFDNEAHLYGREIAAHAWHAKGALRLRTGNSRAAADCFQHAIERVPSHPLALAGLAIAKRRLGDSSVPLELPDAARGAPVDLAIARAALLAEAGRVEEGAALVADAIAPPDDPSAGWILPVEPLLNVLHAPAAWRVALAKLKARAM
jgi:DNA-binding winged helix-turn-helix (wHTH) protein/tetratricopeptide (TPR) repeat protein